MSRRRKSAGRRKTEGEFREEGTACARTGGGEDGTFVESRGIGLGKGRPGLRDEGQGQRGKQGQITRASHLVRVSWAFP